MDAPTLEQRVHGLEIFNSRMSAKILSQSGKEAVEFSRYKQDCRKRALEIAINDLISSKSNRLAVQKNDNTGSDPDTIALADKYYNWLISIPEQSSNP